MAIYVVRLIGGKEFLSANSSDAGIGIGIGTTTTAGRNAGVGTISNLTLVYNTTTESVQVYKSTTGWQSIDDTGDSFPQGIAELLVS